MSSLPANLPSPESEAQTLESLAQFTIVENSAAARKSLLDELNKLQRAESSNVENSSYLTEVNKDLARIGANPSPKIPTLDLQDGGGPAVINGKATSKTSLLLHGEGDGADLNAMTSEMTYATSDGNYGAIPGSVDVYRAPSAPSPPPASHEQSPAIQREASKLEQMADAVLADPSSAHSKALVDELNGLHNQSSAYIAQINTQFQADDRTNPKLPPMSISFWALNPMEDIEIENPPVGQLDLNATLTDGKSVKQLSANSAFTSGFESRLTPGSTEVDYYKVVPQKDGTTTWESTAPDYKVWQGKESAGAGTTAGAEPSQPLAPIELPVTLIPPTPPLWPEQEPPQWQMPGPPQCPAEVSPQWRMRGPQEWLPQGQLNHPIEAPPQWQMPGPPEWSPQGQPDHPIEGPPQWQMRGPQEWLPQGQAEQPFEGPSPWPVPGPPAWLPEGQLEQPAPGQLPSLPKGQLNRAP